MGFFQHMRTSQYDYSFHLLSTSPLALSLYLKEATSLFGCSVLLFPPLPAVFEPRTSSFDLV